MIVHKKSFIQIFSLCIVAALVLGSILFFMKANRRRVQEENLDYLENATEQMAGRIDDIMNNEMGNLKTISYLSGKIMTDPEFSLQALKELEENSLFDYVDVISADGTIKNVEGQSADVSDRFYYKDGMNGNTGMNVDFNSPITNETLAVFYTPLRYEGEIIGVLAGIYREKHMEELISSDFFGVPSDAFLCLQDGTVISRSSENYNPQNLINSISKLGDIDSEEAAKMKDAISSLSSCSIMLDGKGTVCIKKLPNYDWMLFQMFPSEATQTMLKKANSSGINLEMQLMLIFLAYIVFLIISQREEHQAKLREKDIELKYNEKLFDLFSQNSNDIFVLFSPEDYHAEYVSSNLERVLGVSREAVLADARKMLLTARDNYVTLDRKNLDSILCGDSQQIERELLHCVTKEPRWYIETLYHLTAYNSDRYVMVLSDRTEERRQHQALEQALIAAKSANEAKSSFLSNMSHDIRTPMNAIIGFSRLIADEAENPDKVREYIQKISYSSQHLLSLINDILDMSKIENGKMSLHITEFSLPDLLQEINTIIMPQIKAKNQDFEIHIHGNPPEKLLGDKLRINQVLLNLLSNAIKYTDEGGKIKLIINNTERLSLKSVHLRITVEDNGIGMKEDFQKYIFEPFSREASFGTNKAQGTGLGMAITKNLVNMMGGTINLKSSLGQGSAFTVDLDFLLPDQEVDREFWLDNGISRVLTVDNDESVCREICTYMEDTGVDVSYSTDGYTAVELASKAHEENADFNVILLDWKMPGIDGLETARRIREKVGDDTLILVLTAYDWTDIEDSAHDAGINLFLPKPFFLSTFRKVLEDYTSKNDGQAEKAEEADICSLSGMFFLAAEDNELNTELLKDLLAMEGARCDCAKNGEEALEMFKKSEPGRYDMILMDIQMPVMNGYEATKAIRACGHPDAESIPIIAMTANAFTRDVQEALESGMNAHVPKPIDLHNLQETVARIKKQSK